MSGIAGTTARVDDRAVGRDAGGRGGHDLVRFGPAREPRLRLPGWIRPGRPMAGRLAAGAAALAVIVAGVAVITVRSQLQHGAPAGSAAGGRQWYAVSRPVAVKALHHPLLGIRSGWELLASGNGWEPGAIGSAVLVRIEFAAGRVSRTRFPALGSDGPAAVIAGPGQVIVRPIDGVPGYLVPDGRPARTLPAALGQGGMSFPGPRPGQVWVTTGPAAQPVLSLVTVNGARAGQSMPLPAGGSVAVPDGRGSVLVQAGGAVYDARPAGVRWVAAGTLAAVGPSAWLIGRCQSTRRCVNIVINPATGARRVLAGTTDLIGFPATLWPPGLASPDGRLAAVLSYEPGHGEILHLDDLQTGAGRQVIIALGTQAWPGLAWSPDSRWLFSAAGNGTLQVIDPRTGQVRGLGVALPPVTYLAIRDAG
jgi:hypothetical protein